MLFACAKRHNRRHYQRDGSQHIHSTSPALNLSSRQCSPQLLGSQSETEHGASRRRRSAQVYCHVPVRYNTANNQYLQSNTSESIHGASAPPMAPQAPFYYATQSDSNPYATQRDNDPSLNHQWVNNSVSLGSVGAAYSYPTHGEDSEHQSHQPGSAGSNYPRPPQSHVIVQGSCDAPRVLESAQDTENSKSRPYQPATNNQSENHYSQVLQDENEQTDPSQTVTANKAMINSEPRPHEAM